MKRDRVAFQRNRSSSEYDHFCLNRDRSSLRRDRSSLRRNRSSSKHDRRKSSTPSPARLGSLQQAGEWEGAIASKMGLIAGFRRPMSPSETDSLEQSRIRYLMQQQEQFEQEKPKLLQRFLREFVAFENGQILDHDLSEAKLVDRVYRQYGYRDLLIKQVLEQEPHLSVGGAFVNWQET